MENKSTEDSIGKLEVQSKVQENKLSMPTAVVVAGILVAGGIFFGLSSNNNYKGDTQQPKVAEQQQRGQTVDIAKVKIKGEPFIGNPNAPVVMATWLDYQCPFCKRFEKDAITQLISEYVSVGKVKIVIKDFQFLGPDSQTAGLASRAVWDVDPDKYYEWHKAMYSKQDAENSGWGNKADILALTKSIGIDSIKVEKLMTSKAVIYQKAMDNSKKEGSSFGINGTPGSIIGKNVISGAQPYAAVKQLIELELQGK